MISLDIDFNIFSILHAKLLLKLSVIKTFLVIMRSVSTFLGELNMHLLEVENIVSREHISKESRDRNTTELLQEI